MLAPKRAAGQQGAMMLNPHPTRVAIIPVVAEPLVLHPVEIRQLRVRQDELAEEAAADASAEARDSVVAELFHVREILSRFDQGKATITRRAGLAA